MRGAVGTAVERTDSGEEDSRRGGSSAGGGIPTVGPLPFFHFVMKDTHTTMHFIGSG